MALINCTTTVEFIFTWANSAAQPSAYAIFVWTCEFCVCISYPLYHRQGHVECNMTSFCYCISGTGGVGWGWGAVVCRLVTGINHGSRFLERLIPLWSLASDWAETDKALIANWNGYRIGHHATTLTNIICWAEQDKILPPLPNQLPTNEYLGWERELYWFDSYNRMTYWSPLITPRPLQCDQPRNKTSRNWCKHTRLGDVM